MNSARAAALAAFCCLVLLQAAPSGAQSSPEPSPAPAVAFTDITRQAGITWTHTNGATPEKYLIETMGGGAAFLDYNRDGRLDIYLVNSGCHKLSVQCTSSGNALYRQNADGTFTDVTREAGVGLPGYGMGVAVGDFDNDGNPDLYVTNAGANVLYRNNGDGTFRDVTAKAGVAAGGWSASAVFFDYDRDGFEDLFVSRYLEWDYDPSLFCGERRPGMRSYCHPDQFRGISNLLFHNNGDGTFTDVTKSAGVAEPGKGLGVVAFDFNRDGWLDLYVANDAVRNFLFRNHGDGTFSEVGLLAEVAYGSTGKPESGMGVDAADVNQGGLPDLFVTNIDSEPNNYFLNNGDETFSDATARANLVAVAVPFSGFGTRFADFDNDGDLDLIIANGHPLDNIEMFRDATTALERPFLLQNNGGRFEDVGEKHGQPFSIRYNGRGLAMGDIDNDGDPDFLLVQNAGPPLLLRNDGGNRNAWIGFELEGRVSTRIPVGAVVTVVAGGREYIRELVGGASYCSAHDPRILVGLGSAENVESVEVRWPRGGVSRLDHPALRQYHRVVEPVSDRKVEKKGNAPGI